MDENWTSAGHRLQSILKSISVRPPRFSGLRHVNVTTDDFSSTTAVRDVGADGGAVNEIEIEHWF